MRQTLGFVACAISLLALRPTLAQDLSDRFLEFAETNRTSSYDLNTVELIANGKFTVIATIMYNPDVMHFRIKVLDTLWGYCQRTDGEYAAPGDLFLLGKPDLPVETIEVKTFNDEGVEKATGRSFIKKYVKWIFPYKRLVLLKLPESQTVMCRGGPTSDPGNLPIQLAQVRCG